MRKAGGFLIYKCEIEEDHLKYMSQFFGDGQLTKFDRRPLPALRKLALSFRSAVLSRFVLHNSKTKCLTKPVGEQEFIILIQTDCEMAEHVMCPCLAN